MTNHPQWKIVAGFPHYSVSDTGLIKRTTAGPKQKVTGAPLKPRALERGHMYVNLYNGAGVGTSVYVHRIVAEAFLGPPPSPKHQVAHWDGDAQNNNVSNLRWATNKDNSADAIRLGRSQRPRGEMAGRSKLTNEQAQLIRETPAIGCREWARRLGVTHSVISSIRHGKSYAE